MNEQPENDAGEQPDAPTTCGNEKPLPSGGAARCSRTPNHDEDHFDERLGLGWPNEDSSVAGLTQEERVGAVLDRLGVPRGRDGNAWSLVQRVNLLVDRLARRMHTQVENNMVYYTTVNEALALLVGAPNSSQYRIKAAIEKLRAVQPTRKSTGGIIVQ